MGIAVIAEGRMPDRDWHHVVLPDGTEAWPALAHRGASVVTGHTEDTLTVVVRTPERYVPDPEATRDLTALLERWREQGKRHAVAWVKRALRDYYVGGGLPISRRRPSRIKNRTYPLAGCVFYGFVPRAGVHIAEMG